MESGHWYQKMITTGALLIAVAAVARDAPGSGATANVGIEQSLAGFRPYRDNISKAERKYGEAMKLVHGIYTVEIDSTCELAFSTEDVAGPGRRTRLLTVSLWRIGHRDSPMCKSLSTGRGLHFGDTIERALRLYGDPSARRTADGVTLLDYTNRMKCLDKRTQTIQFESMLLEWSSKTKKMQRITISSERTDCALL